MTIATPADVEALLLRPLNDTENGYIANLLARADDLIAGELPHVGFAGTARSTATIGGNDSFEIWLPSRPVTDVISVVLNGSTLSYGTDFDWDAKGDLSRTSGTRIWPRIADIEVVWDHGLTEPPGDIVAVAADMARSAISSPAGGRQETVGQYSITYAEAVAALGLTSEHRRILDRYRYPVPV